MGDKSEHIQYLVMGFDKPFGDNKLVNYQIFKQDGVNNKLLKIQFPIDKSPKLCDVLESIEKDGNGFNIPGKLIGNFPDKALKLYAFLGNFKDISLESMRSNNLKETDDKKKVDFNKPVECVIEGFISKHSNTNKFKRTTITTSSGEEFGIWHHELASPFKDAGCSIANADFVRAFGKLKNGEMNAYIFGVKKYIPEVKTEVKPEIKEPKAKKEEDAKPLEISDIAMKLPIAAELRGIS